MENLVREREPSVLDQESQEDKRANEDDEENNENSSSQVLTETPSQIKAPTVRSWGNTGPKGVIMDYNEHKELERLQEKIKNLKIEYLIKKQCITINAKEEIQQKEEKDPEEDKKNEEEDELNDLLNEDDPVFQKYKAERLKEIRSSQM